MGRSKFPGKPPKTVTRKRIKVLARPEANQTNDSVTVAENIYYGLSLFSESIGAKEKEHRPFHGFSSNEAKLSVSYVKTQQRDGGSTEKAAPATETITKSLEDNEGVNSGQTSSSAIENLEESSEDKNIEDKPLAAREAAKETQEATTTKNSDETPKKAKVKNATKAPLKSVNNILDRHQRTRQLRNSTAKRLLQRAKTSNANSRNMSIQCADKSNGNVRKFVLPVRSAHSSRVIKPNKRFIEELEESLFPEQSENEAGKHSKKARIATGKITEPESATKETITTEQSQSDEKEAKKSKKVAHSASSNNSDEILDSNSSNQDAQTSKEPRSDLKKSQSKLTGRNSCNSTTASLDSTQKSTITANSGGKNSPDNSKHPDKISVPTKVLPDSNVPNVESSRVQTRSGTLSEASNDTNSQAKPETPRELDASIEKGDGDLNAKANDKTVVESKETECEREDAEINNKCSDESEAESTISESGSEHDDHSEDEQSEWTGMKLNGGKVILRKARLKLDNKTLGGTEGPFSTTNNHINSTGNSNPGPTATVKCGVCGAVRFYRFVKQARKFGIHSCESCRKFISKMIKRQACAKSANNTLPILQCHKGDGLCLVPPVVRSQQWNLMRCVYKARCPACWLKMCLKCYNIPSALRTGLNSLLPPLMRDSVISLSLGQEESDPLCHNKSVGSKISWPAEDCLEKNLFKSAMSWSSMEINRKLTHHTNMGGLLSKKLEKFDYPISMSPSKKRKNDNRIKVRKKMKNPLLLSTTSHCSPPAPRQRIDLKGPRVKHVCRSASVALGQPLATFPSSDGKEAEVEPPKDGETTKIVAKVARTDEKLEKKEAEPPKDKENNSQKSNQESSGCTSSSNSSNGLQSSCAKRTKSQQNVLAPNHQVVRSLPKPRTDAIHTISIDFWEQYDPAEVGAKGFALIGSELFHIPAVCFLCGSGGKEPLIHCQCCCEPYHAFCLEPSEWNACALPNWCCPRCTICQTCRLRSGPKLSCIRCRQSFHHSCLSKSGVSARLYSPDRPYVCQSCIKCKSCGSEGVNVHVGNLPLCSMCFKLRQRGNYCPLCQRFYNENDFDTKMMECNECSCWVHARCEGLSDESYQILSYLPDSIEFTCSQCSPRPNSVWRNAIDSELRAGCISVIKALSKNRKACAALKWSPRKECRCKSASARRLEFSDSERYINCEESEDCYSDKSTDTTSNTTATDSKSDSSIRTRIDFESDEKRVDVPRRGLRRLRQKFRLKECTVRVKNCKVNVNNEGSSQESSSDSRECQCSSEQQIITQSAPSLMSIKRKVNSNEYNSLGQFYCEMEQIVNRVGGQDLFDAYHNSLREIFPWFDPKTSKITGDGSSTPTSNKSNSHDVSPEKFDDSIIEKWKEEVLQAPKAIAAKTGNIYSNLHTEDSRICCLCKGLGDGQETKEGRLLYCGQNEWIHANCALWSNEVFEEIDGSLQNVHSAISRGRLIRCTECGKKGASVGCCSKNCNNTFHYPCARNVGLKFNDDKTVFCILHLANCQNKTVQNEADFDLRRAVYVELDRKKKKYAEPDKVKVMIGSLTVDCLGSIVPEFSDTTDKILPANYKCSRLYWSTVNPMKIVRYYIRTYVQMYVPEARVDVENNVTIDHSKEREKEEALLIGHQKLEQIAIKQTLEAIIDSVCNREVDENLAEQNNTDLLPPEIKDAIFEDLPHDLLDGISMQDIFPKMTYEDFLAMDLKTDGVFGPDLLKDEILPNEVDEIMKPPESKISKVDSQCENGAQNDLWLHLEAKNAVHDLMDDLYNAKGQKLGGRELKCSKSEVITNNPLIVGGQRHHQRSCNLTWSCKRDGTYGPTMKRRKLPRPPATFRSAEANVMLVDSQNVERSSLCHELRIPEAIMVTVGRANTPSFHSESVRELKYCLDEAPAINRRVITPRDETKDHKRLLWQHTRQQPRILQVDGPADPSSASECSSPEYNIEERLASIRTSENIPQVDGTTDDSSCDTDWFSYKNRYRLCSTASTSSFDEPVESIRHFSDSEKPQKLSRNFMDENSNDGLRIPQLDGADDISSDEEVNSPRIVDDNSPPTYVPVSELSDRPVTCKRCKCTYRTRDSYDRHLSNCDLVTTSDSDSETMDNKGASPDSRFSPSIGSMSPQQFVTMSPSEGHTLSSEYPDTQVSSPLEASVASPLPAIQIEPIAQALITPQIHTHSTVETVHQTVLTSNDVIVQTQYTRTTTTLPNHAAVLPPESTVEITEIADSPSPNSQNSQPSEQSITRIAQESSNIPMNSPQIVQSPRGAANYSSNVSHNTSHDNTQQGNYQASRVKPKSPRAARPRAKVIKPNNVRNTIPQQHTNQMRYQPMQTNAPVLQLQQQRPAGPTMILQQVQTPGIMSAYVETLQQQSGQNLQYITTLGQQEQSYKPQFIATNQLVPGAYIQAASDNLLALQNGGISVLPSVQIAQPQPTVLGTIIQQQPNAIQCGVISSEQLVLSSAPTLEMFSDSTGSMFVSSQPMYYGLETIVSNTVMSSSQFMTGAVPQVLASSYQTTTQVFQASKLMEPMVDVQTVNSIPNIPNIPNVPAVQAVQGVPTVHGGYVVVNQTPAAPEPRIPAQTHRIQHPTPPQISPVQDTFVARTNEPITLAPCQPNVETRPNNILNDVRPPAINSYIDPGVRNISPPKMSQQTVSTIPRVAVRPSPASHTVTQMNHAQWKATEPIYGAEQIINKNTRPYFDSKHVSENTSMIKSSISSQMPQMNHCIIAQRNNIVNNKVTCDVNNVHNSYSNAITNASSNVVNSTPNGCNAVIQCPVVQGKLTMPPVSSAPLCRPMNRVLPMQAVLPKSEIIKPVKKPEIVIEEPTKPEIKIAEEITKIEEKLVVERIVDRIVEAVKDMPDINDTVDIPEPEPVKLNTQVEETKMEYEIVNNITEKVPEVTQKITEDVQKIPDVRQKIPEVMLNLPEVEQNMSEVMQKLTEVMPKIPEVIQNMPEVMQKIPEAEVMQQLPEVRQKLPEMMQQLPEVRQKRPEVRQKLPDVMQQLPEVRQKLPEVMQQLPEVRQKLPEVMQNLSEVMQELPEVMPKLPEMREKFPEVAEKLPEVTQKLPEEKVDNTTPLKIVLQKQLEDGSYKITHNEISKAQPVIKSVETIVEETPKQTPQITSLQLLPIKTFTLKANKADDKNVNLPKARPPPVAVKKPRFVAKTPAAKKDPPMEKISKPVVTGPSLMYEIKSQDGFTHTASSMAEVWETVFQAVQNARKAHNLPPLAHNPLTEGLGLENNATIYLVEQLAGVNRCTKYKPKFHELKPPKSKDMENEMFSGSVSGAARAEPFRARKVHDMFSWLASRHRQQPKMIAVSETELRRAASTNLPMAMRFRVLKETSKESVGVYHSHIHGRGLFCLRDIEAGEMVIEYAGEVIRASLTDKREKYYDSKNIGCYMFKIDDHLVVDATMKGNAARFINHSCEPNCYSRVVDILGKKHILIFALRRIVQGEELTYDYKFPFEDIKIPCTCGSRRCRKYLN